MTSETLPRTELESNPKSKVEQLAHMQEYGLKVADVEPLEKWGDFSRVAGFELGTPPEGKTERFAEDNPHAVVVDIWKDTKDGVFALPRSLRNPENPEDMIHAAWNLADYPGGIQIGRENDQLWKAKTGAHLPPEVSREHFRMGLDKDGILHFEDINNSNGTAMEVALATEILAVAAGEKEATAPAPEKIQRGFGAAAMRQGGEITLRQRLNPEQPSASKGFEPSRQDIAPELEAPTSSPEQRLIELDRAADTWLDQSAGSMPDIHTAGESFAQYEAELNRLADETEFEFNSELGIAFREAEITLRQIQGTARDVANNLYGNQTDEAIRRLKGMMSRYRDDLGILRAAFSKR